MQVGTYRQIKFLFRYLFFILIITRDEPVKVRLGKIDLSGHSDKLQPYDYDIAKIITHPNYVRRSKENDIALLKLTNRPPKTKYIHPACLYNKNDDPSPLIVTGWGYTQPGK